MKITISILFFITSIMGYAQTIEYNFDGCDYMEKNGLHDDLIGNATLNCSCGVGSVTSDPKESLLLNGTSDFLDFPFSVNAVFEDDFTLSFYFQIENTNETVDILSLQRSCNSIDSSLTMRYNSITETVNVEMADNFATLVDLKGSLDEKKCWHHIVFSRRQTEYFLYLDDVLVDSDLADGDIVLADSVHLSVSNGPCEGNKLQGRIDEFRLYNSFLEGQGLRALDLNIDQILNKDTTVFLGDAVDILSEGSCANSFFWSPTDWMSDSGSLTPNISPEESTTYTLTFINGACTATDSIRIYVLDPNDVQCDQLLLPKAFTPNGDGLNDQYGISNNFVIEELKSFEIFDRWGERVFNTVNKQETWDGTFGGKVMNPGMFFYKITYTCVGEEYAKIDNFSVLK